MCLVSKVDIQGDLVHWLSKSQEWLVSARSEIAEGTHVAACDTISFKEAGEAWITNCIRRRLEQTTIYFCRQHPRRSPLSVVARQEAQCAHQGKRANALRRAALRVTGPPIWSAAFSLMRAQCSTTPKARAGVGKNVIYETPFEFSKRDVKRPEMPTMEEGQKMIARTAQAWENWFAFMLVLIFCGLRASEVRVLFGDSIDFGSDTITVVRRADRWGRIGQPKSKAGTRTIPFPHRARDALICSEATLLLEQVKPCFPVKPGNGSKSKQHHDTLFPTYPDLEAGIYIEVCKAREGWKWDYAEKGEVWSPCSPTLLRFPLDRSQLQRQTCPDIHGPPLSIVQTYDTYGYLFDLRDDDKEALKRTESRVMRGVNAIPQERGQGHDFIRLLKRLQMSDEAPTKGLMRVASVLHGMNSMLRNPL